MANIIATETILKSQIYQRIKDLLVSAGWQNISSNASTDFDVFYSTGEADNKTLYFQLKDLSNTATTTGYYLGARLINKYIPGSAGASGTFDRPSETWMNVYLFSTTVNIATPIQFSYQVNKDRILFFCDVPLAITAGGDSGNIIFIGSPTLLEEEINCRSIIAAQTTYSSGYNAIGTLVANSTAYSDYGLTGAHYALPVSKISILGEYNNDDKRVISEIAYGSTTEGIRGKLDGFYALNSGNVRTGHGDILTDGTSTYKVVKITTISTTLFSNTTMYAFKIS